MNDTQQESRDAERFTRLVAMLQMAAMQQLGKIADPVSGKIERRLDLARETIDTIDVLERRTRGRRTAAEDALLEKVLFELRMNFVEESKRPEAADAPPDGASAEAADRAAGDSAGEDGPPRETESPGQPPPGDEPGSAGPAASGAGAA